MFKTLRFRNLRSTRTMSVSVEEEEELAWNLDEGKK